MAGKSPNPNLIRVDVPEELAPLSGYVMVYGAVPPAVFHEFWNLHIKQLEEAKDEKAAIHKLHIFHRTYITRLPFVAENHLRLPDGRVPLPKDPMQLKDTAVAQFIAIATKSAYLRAVNVPNLSTPSKNIDDSTA